MRKFVEKKSILSLLIAIIMVFAYIPSSAFADEAAEETNTNENISLEKDKVYSDTKEEMTPHSGEFVYVNPLYEDVFTEKDIKEGLEASAYENNNSGYKFKCLDEPEYTTNVDSIIETLRNGMTARDNTIVAYYMQEEKINFAQVRDWIDAAQEETSSPVQGDYLAYQYAGCSTTYSSIFEDNVYKYTITFEPLFYTTAEQEKAVDDAVDALIDDLGITDKMNDYKKTEKLYEYVTENVTYDYENLDDDSYNLKYTAYAALIDKTAICQGYAVLMYRLLNEVGVDTRVIYSNYIMHAWNISALDDKYYHLDATWDSEMSKRWYFLKGEDNFGSHYTESNFLEEPFSTTYPISSNDYVYNVTLEAPNVTAELNESNNTVKLSWDDINLATGYHVYYKEADNEKYEKLGETENTYFDIDGLANGKKYDFKVVPYHDDEEGTVFCNDEVFGHATITMIIHEWENEYTIDKEATCTENGSKSIHCSECDKIKDSIVIEKKGHDYKAGSIDLEKATQIYTCTKCNESEVKEVEVENVNVEYGEIITLSYESSKIDNLTWRWEGEIETIYTFSQNTEIDYDNYYHYFDFQVGPKLESAYIYPTTDNGDVVKIYKILPAPIKKEITICEGCFSGFDISGSAHGDEITFEAEKSLNLKCKGTNGEICTTNNQLNYNHCEVIYSICPETTGTFEINFYAYNNVIAIVNLTVTEHEYGVWVIDSEPSCTEPGSKHKTCSACEDIVTKEIEALGHQCNNWTVTKTATATEVGIESGQCNKCEEEVTREIPCDENVIDAGKCGDNLIWVLTIDGTLTISGYGEMYNYIFNINRSSAPWEIHKERIKKLSLNDGMTSIGDYAFYRYNSIAGDLDIPDSVTGIGDLAFYECSGLTGDLIIPNNVTEIGEHAFSWCTGFDGKLVISEGLKTLKAGAFNECRGLKGSVEIPEGTTTIENHTFCGCESLTGELIIPDSVTSIGFSAFGKCSGLTGDLIIPNSVTSISAFAFSNCTGFDGKLALSENLTNIGHGAFLGCKKLTGDLVIPNNITNIGEATFQGCSRLKGQLKLPENLISIDDYAFSHCGVTGNLAIPKSVLSIGHEAFDDCTLSKVTILNSECDISEGSGTFKSSTIISGYINSTAHNYALEYQRTFRCIDHSWNEDYIIDVEPTCTEEGSKSIHCSECDAIKDVTTIDKLGHVYSDWIIDEEATCTEPGSKHKTCSACEDIVTKEIEALGHQCNNWTVTKIATATETGLAIGKCSVCNEDVTKDLPCDENVIGAGKCGDNLYWLLEANGILTISGTGEMTSNPWISHVTKINKLVLEDGVTSILNKAFYDCSSITGELTIPDSVTNIGSYAFYGCSGLTGDLVIPENVTSIKDYTFYNCNGFRGELVIPNKVTQIGSYAFHECRGLKGALNLPTGLISIGYCSFRGCSSLTGDLIIPNSVKTINSHAFYECSGFTGELSLSDELTSISRYAFFGCSGLTGDLIIPEGVKEIDEHAFNKCSGFNRKLILPNSLNVIGNWAFENCKGLTGDLNIPEGVTNIERGSFAKCSGFNKKLIIPQGLNSIYYSAFTGCSNISEIVFNGDAPTYIADNAFSGVDAKAYYYSDKKYWTDFSFDNYGGKIVWIKKCSVHSWEEKYTIDNEPSCTEEGSKSIHCSRCDEIKNAILIDKISHEYISEVTKEPTTSTVGTRTYTCKYCNDTYTEDIPYVAPVDTKVYRYYGADRYATSIKAAEALKKELGVSKFDTIIVASGNTFADALPGSYLAAKTKAPILLINSSKASTIRSYITKNLASGGKVYVLGGTSAVPSHWMGSIKYERLQGANRYETNLAILKKAGVDNNAEIMVCTGKNFADSLSASATGKPILLVGKSLTASQVRFLNQFTGETYGIIGGTAAVNSSIERTLKSYSGNKTYRLAGSDRYATSVLVAKRFFSNPTYAVLAFAENYPDGLSGGPVAYAMEAPLLLTKTGKKSAAAASYTKSAGIKYGKVLGGPILINDATVRSIFNMNNSSSIIN